MKSKDIIKEEPDLKQITKKIIVTHQSHILNLTKLVMSKFHVHKGSDVFNINESLSKNTKAFPKKMTENL